MEKVTIQKIKSADQSGALLSPFRAREVSKAAKIPLSTARTFLGKHRVGNKKKMTEYFIRIGRGLYRLK